MQLLSARRPRLAIIVVAGVALALGLVLIRVNRVSSFTPTVIISGGWGDGADSFGRGAGPEGREGGPTSFAVDAAGHIYVADTYNHRVKVFDPEGRLLRQFRVGDGLDHEPTLDDLAVTDEGHIYLADNAGGVILKYDPQGRLLATLRIGDKTPAGGMRRIEALAPAPGGGLYVLSVTLSSDGYLGTIQLFSGNDTLLKTPVEVRLDPSGQPRAGRPKDVTAPIDGFAPAGPNRLGFVTPGTTPFQRWCYLVPADGGQARSFLYESAAYLEETALLGMTPSGEFCLGANLSTAKGWIAVLGPDGSVHRMIDGARLGVDGAGPSALFSGRVDPQGRIFLIRSALDRFQVIKVTTVQSLSLIPRWRPVSDR